MKQLFAISLIMLQTLLIMHYVMHSKQWWKLIMTVMPNECIIINECVPSCCLLNECVVVIVYRTFIESVTNMPFNTMNSKCSSVIFL